jgi:hypothetical protein
VFEIRSGAIKKRKVLSVLGWYALSDRGSRVLVGARVYFRSDCLDARIDRETSCVIAVSQ